MLKDLLIRKAIVSDAEALRRLRLQLVKENPRTYGVMLDTERRKKTQYFADIIKKHSTPDSGVFVMSKSGRLIGMAAVRRDKPQNQSIGYLGSLGILKEFQGKELGKAMYALPQKLDNLLRYKNAGKNNQKSSLNSL